MASQNVMYGSVLSPPRIKQLKETTAEFFKLADHTHPWFVHHIPDLCRYTYPHLDVADPETPKVPTFLNIELCVFHLVAALAL